MANLSRYCVMLEKKYNIPHLINGLKLGLVWDMCQIFSIWHISHICCGCSKVPVAFVMGLGDNFTQVANRKGGIVHVQPKKSGQYTKGKGGCKGTKGIAKKKKKKTETFEDMVVEIQKEEPKRKFEGWTNSTTSGSEKKIKLDDVMSLGKVFKDQFGSAEVARQPRWAQ